MLRSTMVRVVLGALAVGVLLPAGNARAQDGFDQGDWELTLGAGGANDNDFSGFQFNLNGSLGYFFNDNLELSVRQSISYTDIGTFEDPDEDDFEDGDGGDGSAINGSTRVALDYHFDLGRWQPFVGANIGYAYGDTVADTFVAGPEAGVKFFLNDTTFIFGLAEYQFFFDEGDDADEAFDDGQFVYTVGLGVRFPNR